MKDGQVLHVQTGFHVARNFLCLWSAKESKTYFVYIYDYDEVLEWSSCLLLINLNYGIVEILHLCINNQVWDSACSVVSI